MFKVELDMLHTYYPSTQIENQTKMSYQISGKLVRKGEGRIKGCLVSEMIETPASGKAFLSDIPRFYQCT